MLYDCSLCTLFDGCGLFILRNMFFSLRFYVIIIRKNDLLMLRLVVKVFDKMARCQLLGFIYHLRRDMV